MKHGNLSLHLEFSQSWDNSGATADNEMGSFTYTVQVHIEQGKMFSKQLASDVIIAELPAMLPGLSRANWLPQQEQMLQCSLSNWLSLRKPVKIVSNVEAACLLLQLYVF